MSTKRKIIFIALIAVCVVSLGVIAYTITKHMAQARDYDDLREVAYETTVPTQEETHITAAESDIPDETYRSVEVVYDSPINFVELQNINLDIYAWIETAGGSISYPILQNRQNSDYYLTHAYDNSESDTGSIFTQGFARHDFMDPLTIVYGHNMWGESLMFGPLNNYRYQSYLEENRNITIYTPTTSLTYKIFACVTYSNDLISSQYDVTTTEGAQAFLADMYELRGMGNIFMDDVTVSEDDHILVLSTCNGNLSQRFLVIAVLEEG